MKIQSVQTFNSASIYDYYFAALRDAGSKIEAYGHAELFGMDTEELIEYLMQEHALSPLEVDDTRQIEYKKVVEKQPYRTFMGDTAYQEVLHARVTLPIKPGNNIENSLKYHASTYSLKVYEFEFDHYTSTLVFNAVPSAIETTIGEYRAIFGQRTAEINSKNIELRQQLKTAIEQRKKKIEEDDSSFEAMMQKITIPLKKQTDESITQVPLHIRKELRQLAVPTSTPPKDLVLTAEQVASIIETLESDGRNFEKTPETYTKLEEPDLRNIMVTHLNRYFPDDATGETFVGLGKADIRLKVYEGQILIAECKYWSGEGDYLEAINQLFRYLTWRHNYGIIIVFSRNQGFTDVLEKVKMTAQSHTTYKGGFSEINPTHFRSAHMFPDDPKKQVEVHHLVFNLHHSK